MKDLIINNVGSMTNQVVTGLVTGDTRVIVDPQWDVFGQYFIQQQAPYPASNPRSDPRNRSGGFKQMTTIVSKLEGPLSQTILAEYGKVSPNAKSKCSIIAKNSARSGSAMSTVTSSAVGA